MRVIHQINNFDIDEATGLKEAFEKTSVLGGKYVIENHPSVLSIGNDVVKVKLGFEVKGEIDNLIKIRIFFPEKKYSLEYIKEGSGYEIDFIYEMSVEKEYFNLVILDKYDLLISSTTYVFNHSSIMEYPILKKDFSDIQAENKVIFENEGIQLVTEKKDINNDYKVIHIWQNLGQHYVYQPHGEEGKYISCMKRDKMCAGIWMLIVTDTNGKLITQFVLDVD